jgi:hypothetical protein
LFEHAAYFIFGKMARITKGDENNIERQKDVKIMIAFKDILLNVEC